MEAPTSNSQKQLLRVPIPHLFRKLDHGNLRSLTTAKLKDNEIHHDF